MTASFSASFQRIWDGAVSAITGTLALKGGSHLQASASYTRSETSLPAGGFLAHVAGLRLGWAFSTRLTTQAFLQYNSLEHRLVANLRLRFIYRPGSDFYVVYNQGWDTAGDGSFITSTGKLPSPGPHVRTRAQSLAIKMTYWLSR